MMKNRLFIRPRTLMVVVVFFTLSSGISWSVENRAIVNPAGSSTVPPSSIGSGLIESPNPIGTSGNLVVTGNVRRGRHFRDSVPYGSTTSFRAGLGSSSLSSFLRDSAGPEDFGRYAGKYMIQPYYSQTETVTTTRPGYSRVFRPTGTRTNDRTLRGRYPAGMHGTGLEKQSLPGWNTSAWAGASGEVSELELQGPQTQYSASAEARPMLQSVRELQLLNRREASVRQQDQQLMIERYREQTQDPRLKTQDPRIVFGQSSMVSGREQKQSLAESDDPLGLFGQSRVSEGVQLTAPRFRGDGLTFTTAGSKLSRVGSGLEMQTGAESTSGEKTPLTGPAFLRGQVYPYDGPREAGTQSESWDAFAPGQAEPLTKGRQLQDESASWGPELQADETKPASVPQQFGIGSPLIGGGQEEGRGDGSGSAKKYVGGPDVLEQIRRQLDDLTKSIDARLQAGADDTRKDGSTKGEMLSSRRATFFDRSKMGRLYESEKAEPRFRGEELAPATTGGELSRAADPAGNRWLTFNEVGSQEEPSFKFPQIPSRESSPLDELNELSRAELSARAKRIRGPHTSPESYSEAKFNYHMRVGEDYLKAGRYYAAADCFALASIYKMEPGEGGSDTAQAGGLALCFAGRGHALFAAGEYISSALFLSRALEIAPEHARTKIDLVAMLGGRNKLESRIADIKEWSGRSGSGQLEFLLGYVYYQMGRLGQAKQAINAASEKMPQSSAVDVVKRAIDDAIAGQ